MYKKCALHSENRRQVWPWQNRGDGCLFYTGRRPGIKQQQLALLWEQWVYWNQHRPDRHSRFTANLPFQKTNFWLKHHLNTTSLVICVLHQLTRRLTIKLRQTTTNPTDGAAAATCCEGINTAPMTTEIITVATFNPTKSVFLLQTGFDACFISYISKQSP